MLFQMKVQMTVQGTRCLERWHYCVRLVSDCYKLVFITALITTLLLYSSLRFLVEPDVNVRKFVMEESYLPKMKSILEERGKKMQNDSIPLLVLFTTMHVTEGQSNIYRNTLQTWPLLKPLVKPVLLYTSLELAWQEEAKRLGWELLQIKQTFGGLPILRHMWLDVMSNFQAHYYAYANADILFDESLILTLISIGPSLQDKAPFIVGRRTNYPMKGSEQVDSLQGVRHLARRNTAELFTKHGEDYFITTSTGFPWKDIPDFVIGRVGYDNWLVSYAIQNYFYVIDATNTVLCLHQTGMDGNYAGFSHKYLNNINKELANSDFPYTLGKTDCAKVVTTFRSDTTRQASQKDITLQVRQQNPCKNIYDNFNLDVNKL